MNAQSRITTHPSEVLQEEFLIPYNISVGKLSNDIMVSSVVLENILTQKQEVNAELALRLSKYLGTTVDFWLNLQNKYDTSVALEKSMNEIEGIIPFDYEVK